MTYFVQPRNEIEILELAPEACEFRQYDLFRYAPNLLFGNHVSDFWGFEFGHECLEVEDDKYALYIGMRGRVWVSYVTVNSAITETYLGVIYGKHVIFVDDDDPRYLQTAGGKVIAVCLHTAPTEELDGAVGAHFSDVPTSLFSSPRLLAFDSPGLSRLFPSQPE
jgi:hypothetical protein